MTIHSRRNFIRNVAAGAAAISVPHFSFGAKHKLSGGQDRPLGIALVGLGSYATNQLAPALQQTTKIKLKGIVTGTPAKAAAWKTKYNLEDKDIYNYETFDTIRDNPDIDVVYVVLPNSMHPEYTIRAAQAGKHVISEKPMAVSVRQCEEMIAACKKAGVQLSIGYRLHFEPHNMEAMRIGQEKVFGDVKVIENAFGFRIGDPAQWRLKKAMAGGGAMMDVGVYCIQAARYITGEEPVAVTAREFKTDPVKFSDVDETIFWQMEFPGKAAANCVTTYAANTQRLFFAAEEGWLELKPAYGYGPIKGSTHQGPLDLPHINHQAAQMDAFATCLIEKKSSSVSGEEGLKDLKVIEAIYKAIESGKRELV